jgi:uncharacterized membrane protein YphA (DoxX/SURF4 family)
LARRGELRRALHSFGEWSEIMASLIVLYLIFLIGVFIAGPGSYSVDALLKTKH